MGRGRTTPDTLKVKTSHVMLHREGTGFLSAPPPQSLHSDLTSCHTSKCWPPPPAPGPGADPHSRHYNYSWLYLCHIMS